MSKIKMRLTLFALALFVLGFASISHAQEPKPLISMDRLAFAVGGNYAWYGGELEHQPTFHQEVEVGLYASYSLTSYQNSDGRWTPRMILTASSLYGMENHFFHASVGLRLPIFVGKD